jgi:uncharacterized protein (DUF488 family)
VPVTLFTVGYERRSVAELVDALAAAGVERVVDVRELPLSRRAGFSKTPLAAALAEAGIGYEHVRALGNPKAIRDRFRSGDLDAGLLEYRGHLLNAASEELAALADSLDAGPVSCLLCLEHEHTACHRGVIADELTELRPGLVVVHL